MDDPVSKVIYHRVQQKAFLITAMCDILPTSLIVLGFIKIMCLKSINYEESHYVYAKFA
jgi:hypothetical protein